MRIKEIEISNFKGFYDTCTINMTNDKHGTNCLNLVVYGENGSGKSSLYQALELFLESSEENLDFRIYRNIFAISDDDPNSKSKNDGYIKLTLRDSNDHIYVWSPTRRETTNTTIVQANKAKGFLDYKSLLDTYFLHRSEDNVDLFSLLIENLLANAFNDITGKTFGTEWNEIQAIVAGRVTKAKRQQLDDLLGNFSQGLIAKLETLQDKASDILSVFDYKLKIELQFNGLGYVEDKKEITGNHIILRVDFFKKPFGKHHIFLNEAKLSAIALSIYLASLLQIPMPDLKLLVLDDVLIGLDMSNRIPVLGILESFFPDHQKIITTYDRQWYEMVRLRTKDSEWKYIEFYCGQLDDFEIPVLKNAQNYLDKAREHLTANDYKACAVYIRTAFEEALKKLATRKKLKITYTETPEKLTSQDFWDVCSGLLQPTTIAQIETYRKFVMNPLSHSQLVNIYEQELDDAITAVDDLRTEIQSIR